MSVVIGRFYKKLDDAMKQAEKLKRMWHGRIAWYVVEAPNGCMVISESQARACFPDLVELKSLKRRRYA